MTWKIGLKDEYKSYEKLTKHGNMRVYGKRENTEYIFFKLDSFDDKETLFYYNIRDGFVDVPNKSILNITPDEIEELRKFVELKDEIDSLENILLRQCAEKALNHLEFYLKPKQNEHLLYHNTTMVDKNLKNSMSADFILLGPKKQYIEYDEIQTEYMNIIGYNLGVKINTNHMDNVKESFKMSGPFTFERKKLFDTISSENNEWRIINERPAKKNPINIIGQPIDYIIKTVNQARKN